MVLPFAMECALYFWSDGFQQGVFGVKALNSVTQAEFENEAYCQLDRNEIILNEDHTYAVSVYSMDADEWNCVAIGFSPDLDEEDQTYCVIDGKVVDRNLSMVLKFVP